MSYHALVIEDNHAFADVVRARLTRQGYEVTIAAHQREAYHLLDKKAFDFVLLDLQLPTHKGDPDPSTEVGFAILAHIRDRFTADELPVIVMTAFEETSQTAVRALKARANDYIPKPFEDSPVPLEEKLAEVVHHLEQRERAAAGPLPRATTRPYEIVFKDGGVELNAIPVKGRLGDLLHLLASRTAMFSRNGAGAPRVEIRGSQIAEALGVKEPSVRQYVRRFRLWIARECERLKKGPVGRDDIIMNTRDWKGYSLNFEMVHISRG